MGLSRENLLFTIIIPYPALYRACTVCLPTCSRDSSTGAVRGMARLFHIQNAKSAIKAKAGAFPCFPAKDICYETTIFFKSLLNASCR